MSNDVPAKNTDIELWRRIKGDFYSPSIHVTESGHIGMNVGGSTIVTSIEEWFEAMDRFLPKPPEDKDAIAKAFAVLKAAMQADPDYAWGWHCNIAMSFYDVALLLEPSAERHRVSNEAAARFMRLCFDVDTSKPPQSIPLSTAQKSIVVSNAEGTESTGTRGEWVTGHYEVTHERPNRSEHWITDGASVRHLVYGDSVRPAASKPEPDAIRDLVPTLNKVLAQIPTGEKTLIARLTSIRGSAEFAPPEGMGHWWNEARAVLQDEIGTPSTEWQRKVESIFSGRRPLPGFIPEEPVSIMPDAPESYAAKD